MSIVTGDFMLNAHRNNASIDLKDNKLLSPKTAKPISPFGGNF
jgi:hypothetical protein